MVGKMAATAWACLVERVMIMRGSSIEASQSVPPVRQAMVLRTRTRLSPCL
jgi:hypothetical protein